MTDDIFFEATNEGLNIVLREYSSQINIEFVTTLKSVVI